MAACPMCGGGKAKRHCPALGQVICATCCGTRRHVDIRCPADCGWLQSARAHPHAAQQRQQAQDASVVVPLLRGLDDGAYEVLMACLPAALQFRAEADLAPLDADLQAAAASLASTAETATRGVLDEHQPDSMVAARLARAMSAPLAAAAEAGVPRLDVATIAAMRRLEETVKVFRRERPQAPNAFFQFLTRVLKPSLADVNTGEVLSGAADADGPRIVIP